MRPLTDAEKLVVLAALREIQDGDITTERAWRIMTLEQESVSATRILMDPDAMDELWDWLNGNTIFIGSPVHKSKPAKRRGKE